MGMSKAFTVMASITGALVVFVMLIIGTVIAQVHIDPNQCPDYCDSKTSTLYLKGVWNDKLKQCVYAIQEPCKYGCETNTLITKGKPQCKEYPDSFPDNSTDYEETLWEMTKDLWASKEKSAKIDIHGTEYQSGQNATIFLQLVNNDNDAINIALCYVDVYYPNKTVFINQGFMMYLTNSSGLYYYDFVVPSQQGVYMLSASCSFYNNLTFHEALKDSFVDSKQPNTNFGDEIYLAVGNQSQYETYIKFDTIPTYELESATLFFDVFFATNNTISVRRITEDWNETGITYNNRPSINSFVWDSQNVPTIGWYGWNITELMRYWSNGTYLNYGVHLNCSKNTTDITAIYSREVNGFLRPAILAVYNVTDLIEIRGSGEVHVTDVVNESLIAEEVWNYPTRNLTYINYTPFYDYIDALEVNIDANFTEILNRLDQINLTTNNTHTYMQGLNNLSGSDVWSYANRTLTDYNLSEVITLLNGINQTTYDIKAFQLNELSNNLTEIQLWLQDINQSNNDTYNYLSGLVNLTAYDIWNYAPRNLTYYPDSVNYTLIQGYVWNATNRNMTYINYTPIYDKIDELNSTLLQAIAESNTTLWNAIASSNSSILAQVNAHNNTIMTKLYLMQDEIVDMNTSIIGEINSLNTSIIGEISLVNDTLYQAILDSNTSIIGRINQHNNTVMLYLYDMQDDIDDILIDTTTIINDIDDVYNVTEEVWWLVWNLSIGNVSVTADVNWTEGAVEMNDISNPTIVESQLLTFAGRDQTPVQVVSRTYCVNNATIAYDINTTRCWLDQCMTLNETITDVCEYGCYQGECNPKPFDRTLFIMLIFVGVTIMIIGMALVYDRFVK